MKFYRKVLIDKLIEPREYVPYYVTTEFRNKMRKTVIPDVEPKPPYKKVFIELQDGIKTSIKIPEGELLFQDGEKVRGKKPFHSRKDVGYDLTLKVQAISFDTTIEAMVFYREDNDRKIEFPTEGELGIFFDIIYDNTGIPEELMKARGHTMGLQGPREIDQGNHSVTNCPGSYGFKIFYDKYSENIVFEGIPRVCSNQYDKMVVAENSRFCIPRNCQVVELFSKIRKWVDKFFRIITTSDIEYRPCTRRKQNEWRISGQDRKKLKIPEFTRPPRKKRKIIRPDTRIRYVDPEEEEVQTRTKIGFSFPVAGHWTFFAYCGMCKGRLFKNKLQHIAPHCIHCGQTLWLSNPSIEPTEDWGVNVLLWKKTWKKDQIRGKGPITEIEYEVTC